MSDNFETSDIGSLPLEHLVEYDAAADYFAKHNHLPPLMGSPGAIDYINADPEAFENRVLLCKYAIAMASISPK